MEFPENVERRASRIAGALLFALAAYVIASAAYGLWRGDGQEFSAPGFVLMVLAIPIMLVLAKAKIRVADQIGSRALRADAIESIACAYLAGVVMLGLLAQLLAGWWWVDSITSLAVVVFLVKEGRDVACGTFDFWGGTSALQLVLDTGATIDDGLRAIRDYLRSRPSYGATGRRSSGKRLG